MGLFGLFCPLQECKVNLFSPIYLGRIDKWDRRGLSRVEWDESDEPLESPERDDDMSLHKMSEVSEASKKTLRKMKEEQTAKRPKSGKCGEEGQGVNELSGPSG
jgi:hypothetical protein